MKRLFSLAILSLSLFASAQSIELPNLYCLLGGCVFTGSISAPNVDSGYTLTTTSNSTLTLTVSSNQQQYFTGSVGGQVVKLPVVSTLFVGKKILIVNGSSNLITVDSSGSNLIYYVPAGDMAVFTVTSISGTTAASWTYSDISILGAYLKLSGGTVSGQVIFSSQVFMNSTVWGPGFGNFSTPGITGVTSGPTFSDDGSGNWVIGGGLNVYQVNGLNGLYWSNGEAIVDDGNGNLIGPAMSFGTGNTPAYAVDIYDNRSTGYDLGDSTTGLWSVDNAGNAIFQSLTAITGLTVTAGVTNVDNGAIQTNGSGLITVYNGISLTGPGAITEVFNHVYTAIPSSVVLGTLYTSPTAAPYNVCYSATVTRAATVSSSIGSFVVNYTTADSNTAISSPSGVSSTANTVGASVTGCVPIYPAASTAFTYNFNYGSVGATTMLYTIHVWVLTQ